jgi:hypothetical protein
LPGGAGWYAKSPLARAGGLFLRRWSVPEYYVVIILGLQSGFISCIVFLHFAYSCFILWRTRMEIVERILGKVVGKELSKEEMEMVAGGIHECPKMMYFTDMGADAVPGQCDTQ